MRGTVTADLFGVRALVRFDSDDVEVLRRRDAGLGAIPGAAGLDALAGLPTGYPVPVSAISWDQLRVLAGLPKGAVDLDGTWVTRLVRCPVTVEHAEVTARHWRSEWSRREYGEPLNLETRFPPSPLDAAASNRAPEGGDTGEDLAFTETPREAPATDNAYVWPRVERRRGVQIGGGLDGFDGCCAVPDMGNPAPRGDRVDEPSVDADRGRWEVTGVDSWWRRLFRRSA